MLNKDDIEQLKTIFVTKDECSASVSQQNGEISELKQSITAISTKLNIITGILGAIGVAVLTAAIKVLFGA